MKIYGGVMQETLEIVKCLFKISMNVCGIFFFIYIIAVIIQVWKNK
jgi:hypothetical protein